MKHLAIERIKIVTNVMVFLTCFAIQLKAQTDTLQNPGQYLFPEFTKSPVTMKTGRNIFLMLNYNIVTEKMVFIQKGQIYDMIIYATVDTVYMQGRKFIPVGKVFYEVTLEAPISLFIQHKGNIQSPPRPAAYGGTSEISSSTYINNISLGNDVYRLKNDPNLIIKPETVYWISINNSLSSFQNEKQLLNIIPDHSNEIKKYIKQNKLKFDNPNDVLKLIVYCNSLKK